MLSAGRLAGVAAALLAAACGGQPRGGHEAHARVACAGCHRGRGVGDLPGPVPDAACASAQCHPSGGPDSARLVMVTFRHRGHPAGDSGTARCASCHRHESGSFRLAADPSACALCHFSGVTAKADQPCATCHANPNHTRSTSQGLALPHAQLVIARVSCTRCHYQLVEGDTVVNRSRCAACHAAAVGGSTPTDTSASVASLHARHAGYTCRSCHEPVAHRVVSMSTSIDLRCADCHAPRHRRPIPADTAKNVACAVCHAGVHQDQQRLVLGILPGEELRPSAMFMGGVTCRSCHAPPGREATRPGVALRTTPAACVGCHGSAWEGVLARWRRGYQRRRDWIRAYQAAADAALAGDATPPAAKERLRQSSDALAFVERARPMHNLPVADQLMRRALTLSVEAYRLAGKSAPPPPELGPAVVSGSCLSCHYGVEEAPIGVDSVTGHRMTHAPHVFHADLTCDACHAPGAAPPGFAGRNWMDTAGVAPGRGVTPTPRRSP